MHDYGWILVLAAYALLPLVTGMFLIWNGKKLANDWRIVAEGVFERVEYGEYAYSRRSGAMVHTTSHYRAIMTTVFLVDGRSFVTKGRQELTLERGTRVRVRRNGFGQHSFEKI